MSQPPTARAYSTVVHGAPTAHHTTTPARCALHRHGCTQLIRQESSALFLADRTGTHTFRVASFQTFFLKEHGACLKSRYFACGSQVVKYAELHATLKRYI